MRVEPWGKKNEPQDGMTSAHVSHRSPPGHVESTAELVVLAEGGAGEGHTVATTVLITQLPWPFGRS